jgi:hypothetical protein
MGNCQLGWSVRDGLSHRKGCAAHLTAIEGSKTIPGLHDQVKSIYNARAGLGLSAAAVRILCYSHKIF